MNLFNVPKPKDDESISSGHPKRGAAAQRLVLADLEIRGFDAAEVNGRDVDIICEIKGIWRKFQVKSSLNVGPFGQCESSCERTGHRGGNRTLLSYNGKIDAFAFVSIRHRLVYYIHINAIVTPTLGEIRPFTRQSCDMSFDETLKRLEAVA